MKLHLGCGKRNFGDEWHHIDCVDHPHVISNDVTNLPYDDNTCDLIYASHLLEYFDRREAVDVLGEWHRVLKEGGVLRLAVPNFNTLALLYSTERIGLSQVLGPLYGKLNDPPIYHKTTYDFASLKNLLFHCGFESVATYDWRQTEHSHHDDQSQAYIPHMDKENGVLISLNVEAIK